MTKKESKPLSFDRIAKASVFCLLFSAFSVNTAMAVPVSTVESGEVSVVQQGKKVTGVVVDGAGIPVIGANVIVKGTTNGTITDFDGNFTLENVPADGVLVVSYIGYLSQEIPVGDQSAINVTLKEDTQALDEVVVVGYGTMRKSDVTGSISTAKGEDMLKAQNFSALDNLRGKAAGVNIFSNSSQPGAYGSRVVIRGQATINASSDPLYVVDGVVMENFYLMNPNDIESMEVLKDASATAIYGARGANGVIMVTTKRGKKGDKGVQVSYAGSVSVAHRASKMDAMNAQEWCDAFMEGIENENKWGGTNWSTDRSYWFSDSRFFDADGNPLEYLQQLVEQYATGVNRKGKRGVESTRDTYRRALDRLERYVRACGRLPASFEDFDKHFFAGFTEYLYNYTYGRGARQKKYTQNTIMNTLKVIKNLLHRAYDLEATTNNYFLKVQTALPSDVSQQVYLDEREVRRLGEVRVDSDEEREVRDMFVIASYTALRISDLQRLGQAIIGHGVIALYQSKTKDLVEIPILKEIAPLVEHYRQTGFPVLKMEKGDWAWDGRRIRVLCGMGLPMGLQYSITAIGSILIQAAVNHLGTDYITAVTAASKVHLFLCCPFDAMGSTMATYGGQNIGARKPERPILLTCILVSVFVSAVGF